MYVTHVVLPGDLKTFVSTLPLKMGSCVPPVLNHQENFLKIQIPGPHQGLAVLESLVPEPRNLHFINPL